MGWGSEFRNSEDYGGNVVKWLPVTLEEKKEIHPLKRNR
jgi:hypothetical protein